MSFGVGVMVLTQQIMHVGRRAEDAWHVRVQAAACGHRVRRVLAGQGAE